MYVQIYVYLYIHRSGTLQRVDHCLAVVGSKVDPATKGATKLCQTLLTFWLRHVRALPAFELGAAHR